MTKKCKFEVEVTYNSDYFAEGEIRDTIKKALKDLNDQKEKKFGRLKLCDPGKTNHGVTCNVTDEVVAKKRPQIFVEEIAELDELMKDNVDPKIVLPDAKVEELLKEVETAFSK
jgi:hypothetical protein